MSEPAKSHIQVADYVIFVGTLVVFMAIGLFFAVFKKVSNRALLSGEQNMNLLPVVFSIVGGTMSGLSVLGFPAEIYAYGTQFSEFVISQLVFIPLFTFLFIPTFYKWQLPNLFKYFDHRFKCKSVRLCVLGFFIADGFLYLGAVLFAPSLAISAVTDFPMWAAVLCMGGSVSVYTAIGGFQAVVWIEFLQTLILMAGMLAIFIQGILTVGGLENAFRIAGEHNHLNFMNFNPDPFVRQSSLTVFFGQGILWGGIFAMGPSHVLRFCSMKSIRSVRRGIVFSTLMLASMMALVCLCGLVIFATYAGCDPLAEGKISRPDQVVPYFVVDKLGAVPGLLGLFMAALFSGVLSSVSANLNALVGIVWEDLVKPREAIQKMGERQQARLIKLLVFVGGLIPLGISFFLGELGAILTVALTFNGVIRGGMYGLFVVGFFAPVVEKKGALVAFLVSEILMGWLGMGSLVYKSASPPLTGVTTSCEHPVELAADSKWFGRNDTTDAEWPEKIYSVSFTLYPMIGLLLVALTSLPVSWFVGRRYAPDELENVVHPVVLRWYRRRQLKPIAAEESKDLMELERAKVSQHPIDSKVVGLSQ